MKKILIADSSEGCRILAKNYMNNMGINNDQIIETNNPEECLNLVSQDLFDVVFLGTRFPKISGNEIAREIKKTTNGKGPKIIAYTGDYTIDKNVFDKHILKPTNMENFNKALYEVLMSIEAGN